MSAMKTKVFIAGAGPGAPSLITLKTINALKCADVVVYDRLVNPILLEYARDGAELVYAGKGPGSHAMTQAAINRLLVEKAREGLRVVRLKGGDPLLFGRGAEEADHLAAEGIEFEIIPGVTAASGAAAYAGVALTDRRESSSVTFVTGHGGEGAAGSVDWGALARTGSTLVVYMGVSSLGRIAAELERGGLAADTPVALVENATLPSQRVVCGTLADIAEKAQAAGVAPPCVTIIGKVARDYPSRAWFDRLPLFGTRVCITRPAKSQGNLARALGDLGAEVIRFATIEIVSAPPEDLDRALSHLSRADWVVFTSANGVESFYNALAGRGLDSRALAGAAVAAIGTATGEALGARGITPDLVPEVFTGEGLLEALLAASREGETFLLWRAAGARRRLAEGLTMRGRRIIEVNAYEAVAPREVDPKIVSDLIAAPPSAILFSSASTARNFVEIVGADAARAIGEKAGFVSIGPVTTAALREMGLPVEAEARVHTSRGLLETLLTVLCVTKA